MESLMWPGEDAVPGGGARPGTPPGAEDLATVDDDAARDLELDAVVDWIGAVRPDRRAYVRHLLTHPPLRLAAIRWRAAAMRDVLASPRLADALESAARALDELGKHRPEHFPSQVGRAARIGARVVELRAFLRTLAILGDALAGDDVRAPALLALREDVRQTLEAPETRGLQAEMPALSAALEQVRSVTVGINVGPGLEPEGAVLLGFSNRAASAVDTALLRFTRAQGQGPGQASGQGQRGLVRLFRHSPVNWQGEGRMVGDVQALLEAVATPIERALHGYRSIQTQAVLHLHDEFVTLVGAARMARQWAAAGLPASVAEFPDPDAGEGWAAQDGFHPVLARQTSSGAALTLNGVAFGPRGTVWILTGPNRGGKTTYLRAAGLVQVLGQCGLPVPARSARLRPAARVFTHFPVPEAGVAGQGRLDEEAERMGRIFAACSPGDMVLLNEVLAGTSAPEGSALAADILRGLRIAGCNVVYATHLHDLARRTDELNGSVEGAAPIRSLTVRTEADHGQGALVRRPTYRVVPGEPEGASFFASQIARRHGVSLPQIVATLQGKAAAPG